MKLPSVKTLKAGDDKAGRPLVSIILPCFNSEDTIRSTITSILRQSYDTFELLIYDDCSVDSSRQVIEELCNEDERIVFFKGKTNQGVGYARHHLIQNANGSVLAFIDSDDTWHQSKLSKQLDLIINENYDLVVCGYSLVDSTGNRISFRKPPPTMSLWRLHLANWIPMSMAAVKTSVIGVKEMPTNRKRQDYLYWLRIFRKNPNLRYGRCEELLGIYTRRKNSLSSSKLSLIAENYKIFNKQLGYSMVVSLFFLCCNIFVAVLRR